MAKRTRKQIAKAQAKNVGRAPVWLKTVAIAKPQRRRPISGTFGVASPCVSIDINADREA